MDYQTINFALLVLTFVFVLIISTKVNDHQSSINSTQDKLNSTQDKLSSLQSQFPRLGQGGINTSLLSISGVGSLTDVFYVPGGNCLDSVGIFTLNDVTFNGNVPALMFEVGTTPFGSQILGPVNLNDTTVSNFFSPDGTSLSANKFFTSIDLDFCVSTTTPLFRSFQLNEAPDSSINFQLSDRTYYSVSSPF